mgnify:CR=1 FL=1
MVFAGVYPIEAEDYENLRASLMKSSVERCLSDLPAGVFFSTGLWIPLRLLGTASHGNCAGTTGP